MYQMKPVGDSSQVANAAFTSIVQKKVEIS